jgi:hypothetical protein
MVDTRNIKTKELGAVGSHLILATWETEIWRIMLGGQLRQILRETPSPK